jgi:ankyrin repeat protein
MADAASDGSAIDEQLFDAASNGDVVALQRLLDAHPGKLHARKKPYDWSLLHLAHKHAAAVDLLLARGLDVNTRESGDNTYAMHWAAAGGHLDVVRRLADAGGDVIGSGDDHALEVIGWATCWPGADDDAHREVAEFLVSRGAQHHIFSAIALNRADDVRRLVAADSGALSRRQSRNENHRTPLHFAVEMNRRAMVALLIDLGADPLAVDLWGMPVAVHAAEPDVDRPVMERIRAMTAAEMDSARAGHRQPRCVPIELTALLALRDWETAGVVLSTNPALIEPGGGVLHLMVKRNDAEAVKWLLARGASPSGRWAHWDSVLTPLHLAAMSGHVEIASLLLNAGADPTIRDSLHDSDASGWAQFFDQADIIQLIQARRR